MADEKISGLNPATLPLSGTEVLPIVQGGVTVKVAVSAVGGGGIPDAPNNANAYVRSALSWVVGYTKSAIDTLLANKVDKNTAITGATKTKITYDDKGLVTSGSDLIDSDIPALPQSKITNLTTDLSAKESTSNKDANNGYCGLDSGGKVPIANLPTTLLKYMGVWNASTNTPTLTNPDLTKIGNVYNVSVAGTQFGINWSLGDWLIYNASGVPEKSDNSDDVVSVNGQTGVVTLTTANISEVTNLYFTTARVLATLLTGLSLATGGAIVSTDSVLIAFGKIQKQLNDGFTGSNIRSLLGITTLSGSNTGDQDLSDLMVKTANGSDINNIAAFRANLGVDKVTSNGNSNYTILSTDKAVITSATLTANRTWTLPLANSVNAGYEIIVADLFGAISPVNSLIVARSGSNTINGVTSTSLSAQYGMRRFISDGVSRWTFDAGVLRISDTAWIDYSGTSTIVGFSSFTTRIIRYMIIGKIVHVWVFVEGTSNLNTFSITLANTPSSNYASLQYSGGLYAINITTTNAQGYVTFSSASNVFTFGFWSGNNTPTLNWGNVSTKRIQGQFSFEID